MADFFNFFIDHVLIRPFSLFIPLCIYFFIEYIRRVQRFYYSPVYFPFALESINPLLARYYGSNQMTEEIVTSVQDMMRLRQQIWINSAISFFLSGILIPFFVGWLSSLLVMGSEFYIAAMVIILVRFENILRSIKDLDVFSTGFRNRRSVVASVSFAYFVFMCFFLFKGFQESISSVNNGDWWAYIKVFFESTVSSLLISGVLVGVVAGLLTQKIMDENVRNAKLQAIQETRRKDSELN